MVNLDVSDKPGQPALRSPGERARELRVDNARLREEIARMRRHNDALRRNNVELRNEVSRLLRENAALRAAVEAVGAPRGSRPPLGLHEVTAGTCIGPGRRHSAASRGRERRDP